MGSGFLHIPQRDPGVEGGGDERVAQRMGRDDLGDSGTAGSPADYPSGTVPVQPTALPGHGYWPAGTFPDGQVDRPGGPRCQRDGHYFAALAGDGQGPVAALEPKMLDAGTGGLRYPQPVQGEQGDQRAPGGWPEPGGDQQRAELVAIKGDRIRFVVHPRTADVRGGRTLQELFFDSVLVEPGDGGQPPRDGGAGPAHRFQVAGEALDVRAADGEQGQRACATPAGELAQVQGVGLAGQAAYPARNPASASRSASVKAGWIEASAVDEAAVVIGHLPAGLRPGLGQLPGPSY